MDAEFINSIVENFIGGICVFEVHSKTLRIRPIYLNKGIYRLLGGNKSVVDKLFENLRLALVPDDKAIFEQGLRDILADDGPVTFSFRVLNSEDKIIWFRINGNLYSRQGNMNTIVTVITDCTEEKLIEEEFKRQSDNMSLLIGSDITFDFNCRTDVCVFHYTNKDSHAVDEVIQGYIEKLPKSGIHEEDIKAYAKVFTSALYHSHRDSIDFRAIGFDESEEYRWYRADIVSIMGKEGYVSHVIGHVRDIHEDKIKEIELQLRADHDGLTGLMNKKATEELISEMLLGYEGTDSKGALFILDTDNFKGVNDKFGHSTGDRVLASIGQIIKKSCKGRDVTGRIGGDEFLIFADNVGNSNNAALLARNIEEQVIQAFDGEELEGKVSMSIGIAMFPSDGEDFQTLYKHADKALYVVKENGKANWKVYDERV